MTSELEIRENIARRVDYYWHSNEFLESIQLETIIKIIMEDDTLKLLKIEALKHIAKYYDYLKTQEDDWTTPDIEIYGKKYCFNIFEGEKPGFVVVAYEVTLPEGEKFLHEDMQNPIRLFEIEEFR